MTIEQIKKLHDVRPFQPFRIHMADGRHIDVKHSECLARSPGGRTFIVYTGDEDWEIVDLLLVTSLELINGRAKRSRSS